MSHSCAAPYSCSSVRLPKVSSLALSKKSAILFILIYSFIFFPDMFFFQNLVSSLHYHVLSQFYRSVLANGGMYGGASLKAKRYKCAEIDYQQALCKF